MYNMGVCLEKKTQPLGRQPQQGDTMKEKNNFWIERELDLDNRNQSYLSSAARTEDEDDGSWWVDEK